jgi:two-component system chemotaxis sensor kinase CheA
MGTFRVEAEEHVRSIGSHLLALERGVTHGEPTASGETDTPVEAAFRAVHTLKGAARSVGLEDVESLCQSLESVLSRAKRGLVTLTPDLVARLQATMDGVARRSAGTEDAVPVSERVRSLEGGPGSRSC